MKQYQALKDINANSDCYTQLEVHEHQPTSAYEGLASIPILDARKLALSIQETVVFCICILQDLYNTRGT